VNEGNREKIPRAERLGEDGLRTVVCDPGTVTQARARKMEEIEHLDQDLDH
jgi:hypothetical protein